ncbi:hypothetical protein KR059_006995, partial [Drosophila kikkawai]
MEPQRTLTDLPFEVLDLIFKALAYKDLRGRWPPYTVYHYSKDKLSLAETCEYLGQAFAYHSRDIYKKAIYDRSSPYISERDYSVIVSLCGSTAVEYVGSPGCNWSAEVAKAVGQYCPNLQRVRFQVYLDNGDILISLIHKAKNAIKSLDFGYASHDPLRIGSNIMHKIPELPLLKTLTLDSFRVDEAYEIQRFLSIEELFLQSHYSHREDLKTLNLFKVCAPLKKLRILTVIGVHIISETDEDEAIPEFPALEHFKLSSCIISMEFPSCPKLKILDISCTKCHIEGLVCKSVLKQGKDLERLIVESRPSQFDNESLLEVIQKFRKLRYFNVPIRKIKFDLLYATELVNVLRENGVTKEDPLELVLDEVSKIHWLHHWVR